ncbi:hypothetical protein [Mucilaginibacter flavidus]|uniref:hypothetical protein n=1 Tax=Mucilaginibacter flavidus TaxID=2949309 RepID=UPI00209373FB|nr:hypothetical protein [Mucilaginibacter flavidus]MCO5947288.1 hypothetical protein [Mucilaginibacter flavidus]
MKVCLLSLFLLFTVCACQRNKPSGKNSNSDTVNRKPPVKFSYEQWLKQAEKDHEIYAAFEPSKNTIVLLRRSVGFEFSENQGKTWSWLGKEMGGINEISVDDKGTWWAMERWKGIHEPSYCRMYKSVDFGKTWEGYIFSPLLFFPYHIYSKPNQQLTVTNYWDNKVYSLLGNDPRHHWKYIKQLPKDDGMADDSVENYFIDKHLSDDNKLYVKRKSGKTDTLIDFKKAGAIYSIEKIKDIIYVAGPAVNYADSSYFAIIKNERVVKEYVIPGVDLNISKTQFNHVFLTATTGAYLLKNDKLIHIFK